MPELTKEEKLAKLGNYDQEIERLRREAEPLRKDLGGEGGGGGTQSDVVQQQKDDAALFDALSKTGGLTELFVKDPATFARLEAAKRGAGEAELRSRNMSKVP